ncbi:hypothetical protein V5O48_014118 [Marasmius crinis-equi]|uniref:DUF6535 domain-containing protein n=1 Tax=Marasmius crinis-equi TaxID=585013 RepID=A0ABR3EY80_9AGAR
MSTTSNSENPPQPQVSLPLSRAGSSVINNPTQVSSAPSNRSFVDLNDPTQIPLPPSITEPSVEVENSPNIQPNSTQVKEPSLEESWDVVMKQLDEYDRETYNSRVEDLNTLLVFAGLLSAVVTAFTIESYQSLHEDPADLTVALLAQISQQLTQTTPSLPTTQSQPFHPSSSSVRINCFWFLSLILSLATSLFALLCKQWLRNNQRDASPPTPQIALALRQMQHDSLEKGRVPLLLSMLPVLLEFALLFFFAGILDLFWSLKVVPLFVVGCISIGMSGLLYCITTIIPGLTTMRMIHRKAVHLFLPDFESPPQVYQPTWPYKSPQAWGFFKFFTSIYSWAISGMSVRTSARRALLAFNNTITFINRFTNWSRGDLFFVEPWWLREVEIDIHLWEGIKSITVMFRDIDWIQPYFVTILETYSPSIAIPLALPYLHRVYTWMSSDDDFKVDSFVGPATARNASVEKTLDELGIPSWAMDIDRSTERDFVFQLRIIKNNWLLNTKITGADDFVAETQRISKENVPKRTKINFTPFFHVAKQLWEDNHGMELLDTYRDEWVTYSGSITKERIAIDGDERYQLMGSFARYIKRHLNPTRASSSSSSSSEEMGEGEEGLASSSNAQPILASDKGLEFLHFIHNQIIGHKLYDMEHYDDIATFDIDSTRRILNDWVAAMEVVRRMRGLPGDYFAEFPPDEPDTQESEETVGKSGVLGRIGTSMRNALARTRAGNTPDSQA